MKRLRWWLLAIVVAALFGSLGVWQLGRAQQKRAMLAQAQSTIAQRHALALTAASDPARVSDYDWAAGSGRFLSSPAVLLDSQVHNGQVGVRAYRAFLPDGATQPLLVDLGWLPVLDRHHMPALPPPELREVRGLLMPPPSHGLMAPVATRLPDGDVLVTATSAKDLPALLGHAVLAPRVLRLDPGMHVGGERDLDVLPNTMPPERHVAYAVQWFAMAATILILALLLNRRTRRRDAHV
ncbi:MAG: SURF1 family protein [Xanthomonadales bacterium]|nr:SURF1 family protein [Xanthomonadales bacterium]